MSILLLFVGNMKNYYDILELPSTASDKEIKKAYYRLSLRYHPDKNTHEESTQRFQDIAEAYHVLSHQTPSMSSGEEEEKGFDLKSALSLFKSFNPEFYDRWLEDLPEEWVESFQHKLDTLLLEPETKIFHKMIQTLLDKEQVTLREVFVSYITPKPQPIQVELRLDPEEEGDDIPCVKKVIVKRREYDYCQQHIHQQGYLMVDYPILVPVSENKKELDIVYRSHGDRCHECGHQSDIVVLIRWATTY